MEIAFLVILALVAILQIVLIVKFKGLNKKMGGIRADLNFLENYNEDEKPDYFFETIEKYQGTLLDKMENIKDRIDDLDNDFVDFKEEIEELKEEILEKKVKKG